MFGDLENLFILMVFFVLLAPPLSPPRVKQENRKKKLQLLCLWSHSKFNSDNFGGKFLKVFFSLFLVVDYILVVKGGKVACFQNCL